MFGERLLASSGPGQQAPLALVLELVLVLELNLELVIGGLSTTRTTTRTSTIVAARSSKAGAIDEDEEGFLDGENEDEREREREAGTRASPGPLSLVGRLSASAAPEAIHVNPSNLHAGVCGVLSSLFLCWALPGCERPAPAVGAASAPPAAPPAGMVRIPGGTFRMGTNEGYKYEGPVHEVTVAPFYLDAREVTNAQFAAFVKATGHRTVAERETWSTVFDPAKKEWRPVTGAYWRHPSGPGSSIKGKDEFPVVQVSYEDALAYAKWAGKRLPTEAEWEFAARGGAQDRTYSWGNELVPGGKYMANYWQGVFPRQDGAEDGFAGLAPGGSFPPNDYGLYDMAANAWEWVQDGFDPQYYERSAAVNPVAAFVGQGYVIRGGSFLCAANYCAGYRVAARNHNDADSAGTHQGFRCAQSLP